MIEPITDHVAGADALFIDEYKDKPRLSAWLASYTRRVQELEDAAWQVILRRAIEVAEGVQLDKLGRLVGQARIGLNDTLYRIAILTRIRANTSLGRPVDIIDTAALALPGVQLEYQEFYAGSWIVETIDPISVDALFVANLIRAAKPAGVGGHLHFTDDDEDETFAFAEGDEEVEDEDRGLADDDGTEGGKLIGAT